MTSEERRKESEAFHRGLFEAIFGGPPETVIPMLRDTIQAERARRERLAAENPDDWEEATITEADIEKKRQERRRGRPVGTVTIDNEENDDWIRTDETRDSETRIHDELAEEHEEEL